MIAPHNANARAVAYAVAQYRHSLCEQLLARIFTPPEEASPALMRATRYDRELVTHSHVSDGMQQWLRYWDSQQEREGRREEERERWRDYAMGYPDHARLNYARYVAHMTEGELATYLQCSVRTVYRHIHHAQQTLCEHYHIALSPLAASLSTEEAQDTDR